MKERTGKNHLDAALVLLLFAVFASSILMVMLTGAELVEKLSRRDDKNYEQRTAEQYITTRIRQADCIGMLSVRDFAESHALVITEEIDGCAYETLVYCFDGFLRELFCEAGSEPEPNCGEAILPLTSLDIYDKGSFLQLELRCTDGEVQTLILALRSREEAAS